MARATLLSRANNATRSDRRLKAKAFTNWLASAHPGLTSFAHLRPSILTEYIRHLETAGKSYDAIRTRLDPIRLAWRMLAADYPDLVTPWPRPSIRRLDPKPRPAPLTPTQLVAYLKALRRASPVAATVAALQALAGMRIREALHLRPEDVNLRLNTLTVTDTPRHKVKTRASVRTIPIPPTLAAILRTHMADTSSVPQAPRSAEGISSATARTSAPLAAAGLSMFLNRYGTSWTDNGFSRHCTLINRRIAARLKQKLPPIQRALRGQFASWPFLAEIPPHLLQAYLGQAPTSILERHYRQITPAQLRPIAHAIEREFGKKLA
jgi:integrase